MNLKTILSFLKHVLQLWNTNAYRQGRPCFSGNLSSVICFDLQNQLKVHLYIDLMFSEN